MFVIVLLMGLAGVVIGIVAGLFGISIKEFSLGNTMLIVGGTALFGGLVLIGIAGVIRELHRIAEALARGRAQHELRPAAAFVPPVAEGPPIHVAAPVVPPVREEAAPMREPQPIMREPQPIRLRLVTGELAGDPTPPKALEMAPQETQPSVPRGPDAGTEQPQQSAKPAATDAVAGAEPPTVEEPDAIPLSPQGSTLRRDQADASETDVPETEPEEQHANVQPGAPLDTREPQPVDPEPLPAVRKSPFDAIWPRPGRPAQRAAIEPPVVAPGRKAAFPSASAGSDAGEEARQSGGRAQLHPGPRLVSATAEPRHPVSILKSGVVDGMAYTLYSDGSIEAELPTGTVRFESINDLRTHLERAG